MCSVCIEKSARVGRPSWRAHRRSGGAQFQARAAEREADAAPALHEARAVRDPFDQRVGHGVLIRQHARGRRADRERQDVRAVHREATAHAAASRVISIDSALFGKPQMLRPASQVKPWFTGSFQM